MEKRRIKEEKDKARDEEKEINELKKKMAGEKLSPIDRIGNALNILAANNEDDFYDNRIEVIANLKFVKEQLEAKGININNDDSKSTLIGISS